jgi:hypothetical protein
MDIMIFKDIPLCAREMILLYYYYYYYYYCVTSIEPYQQQHPHCFDLYVVLRLEHFHDHDRHTQYT